MINYYKDILERDEKNQRPKEGDCCLVYSLNECFIYYKGAWHYYPEMLKVISELEEEYNSLSLWGKFKYNLKMLYEAL